MNRTTIVNEPVQGYLELLSKNVKKIFILDFSRFLLNRQNPRNGSLVIKKFLA